MTIQVTLQNEAVTALAISSLQERGIDGMLTKTRGVRKKNSWRNQHPYFETIVLWTERYQAFEAQPFGYGSSSPTQHGWFNMKICNFCGSIGTPVWINLDPF